MCELEQKCREKLQQKYGEYPPKWAAERMGKELALIAAKGNEAPFLQVAEFVQKERAEGRLSWACGTVADSLVACLLGITECNPLPIHYLCTHCHYAELGDETACGLDLPDKACPHCGRPMKKEGFHLPYACFLGGPGQEKDLHFEIRVGCAELEGLPCRNDGPVHGVPTAWLRQLNRLAAETGIFLEDVPQEDHMALRLLRSHIFQKFWQEKARRVLELANPTTFSQLVQVCTFINSAGPVLEEAPQNAAVWQDPTVCREDMFADLIRTGMSQTDAIWYTDRACSGKFRTGMPDHRRQQLQSYGVSERYMDAMENIQYLFPKAHTIGYLLLLYRLAWYEQHTPEAYFQIMEEAGLP